MEDVGFREQGNQHRTEEKRSPPMSTMTRPREKNIPIWCKRTKKPMREVSCGGKDKWNFTQIEALNERIKTTEKRIVRKSKKNEIWSRKL